MKTKSPSSARSKADASSDVGQLLPTSQAERLRRIHEWWAKLGRLPKAKRRARMIELGMLTPEGKVPVYPMDHVPLGPRE